MPPFLERDFEEQIKILVREDWNTYVTAAKKGHVRTVIHCDKTVESVDRFGYTLRNPYSYAENSLYLDSLR